MAKNNRRARKKEQRRKEKALKQMNHENSSFSVQSEIRPSNSAASAAGAASESMSSSASISITAEIAPTKAIEETTLEKLPTELKTRNNNVVPSSSLSTTTSSWSSWSDAFAAAKRIEPPPELTDFLNQSNPNAATSSKNSGKDGIENGLGRVARLAQEETVCFYNNNSNNNEDDNHHDQNDQPTELMSSQMKIPKTLKRKMNEKEEEEREESKDNPVPSKNKKKKKKKKKRKKQKQNNQQESQAITAIENKNNNSKENEKTPLDSDASHLEGRLIQKNNHSVMVLIDRTSNLVYSTTERNQDGSFIRVGQFLRDTVQLDHDCEEISEITEREPKKDSMEETKMSNTLLLSSNSNPDFPFPTNPDDHCESPLEAYEDILPILEKLSHLFRLSRNQQQQKQQTYNLSIYDPYYCDGSVKKNLSQLGYSNVYNQKEDCYEVWSSPTRYPTYDVLITNPPYSDDHMERLIQHITTPTPSSSSSSAAMTKPWLLLLPTFVHKKEYYIRALQQYNKNIISPFYLVPNKRYVYRPPPCFREHRKSDVHKKNSPFVTMWYIWGGSMEWNLELMDYYRQWSAAQKRKQQQKSQSENRRWCELARSRSSLRDLRRKKK